MNVAHYRYVTNAAQLAGAGYLGTDRDISHRDTPLIMLDDPAIVREAIYERLDLLWGYPDDTTLGIRIDSGAYRGAATLYPFIFNQTTKSAVELDTTAAVQGLTDFTAAWGIKPVGLAQGTTVDTAVDALCGARTTRTFPSFGVHEMPAYSKAKAASNAIFDLKTFRVPSSAHNVSLSVTEDPAGAGQFPGNAAYYLRRETVNGVTTTKQWGENLSFSISATKANGGTAFSSPRYSVCAAIISGYARRTWWDTTTGQSFDSAQALPTGAFSLLQLARNGAAFQASRTIGSAAWSRMAGWLDQAFGAVPAMQGDGGSETQITISGVSGLIFFLDPLAFAAQAFQI